MRLNENFRKDISIAIGIWRDLLNEFLPNKIEYIFTKGSSAKKWESDIDYVPLVSDVDIHIKFRDKRKKLLSNDKSFEQATFFTSNYEKRFADQCQQVQHTIKHLPRVQIVQLDFHGRKGYVVPPREKDVTWIQGKTQFLEEMDHDELKEMDRKSLLNEKPFIDALPDTFFELSGLDYYTLFYRLSSRISPSPIRLLTQVTAGNPHDLWALNRSSIKKILIQQGYNEIATHLENFYLNGWKLFDSSFSDPSIYRSIIKDGYFLLENCYEEVIKLA